jgi:hypothetical protein
MNGESLWDIIISSLTSLGDESQTTTGLWFRASSDKGKLYVDKATSHIPSSKLTMRRPISKNDFLLVYSYYDRWVNGETRVRQEVSSKSKNTAYIFALIEKFIK